MNGAESGYVVGPGPVFVAPTAKQSEAVGQATDSSEALAGPGGFWAPQLTPSHSQACGRAGRYLPSGRKPTISQREPDVHEMPFGLAALPEPEPWTLQPVPFHRSANMP
jgi:hypothetical protein